MTEKTLASPLTRWLRDHAASMLACCGVVAIWIGPTVWLQEAQRETIRAVQADIGRIEAKIDQVIWYLAGLRPQEAGHE